MKKLLIATICLALTASAAFSQTQSLSFNDNNGTPNAGTYNPNVTFSLDVFLTFSGYQAIGVSYWLEVPTALAPFISITSVTYFTFTDGNQPEVPKTFDDSMGASPGFLTARGLTESGDLGGTVNAGSISPGTVQITTLSISLTGAPVGTYNLQSTVLSPKGSIVTDTSFGDHALGSAVYTITVVPEPATWSMIAFGGLCAFGVQRFRRRR